MLTNTWDGVYLISSTCISSKKSIFFSSLSDINIFHIQASWQKKWSLLVTSNNNLFCETDIMLSGLLLHDYGYFYVWCSYFYVQQWLHQPLHAHLKDSFRYTSTTTQLNQVAHCQLILCHQRKHVLKTAILRFRSLSNRRSRSPDLRKISTYGQHSWDLLQTGKVCKSLF